MSECEPVTRITYNAYVLRAYWILAYYAQRTNQVHCFLAWRIGVAILTEALFMHSASVVIQTPDEWALANGINKINSLNVIWHLLHVTIQWFIHDNLKCHKSPSVATKKYNKSYLESSDFSRGVHRTKIRTSAVFWVEYDVYSGIIAYYQREYWFYSS